MLFHKSKKIAALMAAVLGLPDFFTSPPLTLLRG
jgi:hypothetical protein